jgi:phenylacetate-CoA ligase
VQLRLLIAHAYENVPAYRRLYDEAGIKPNDVRTLDDVQKLPVITKAQVRADRANFIARNVRSFHPVQLNTSGTTGTPFQFYSSRRTDALEWAFFWRHKGWGGARLWEPIISMGGKVIVPLSQQKPPFWRYNRAEGMMWLSTFHMTPDNLDIYVDQVRRSGITFIKGYPSNLHVFAQHLANRDIRLPMRAVFTGSEPLFEHVRNLIEDRFVCKVFDWYGVSERVVTASQCDLHRDYHVHMEGCLVEVLNDEKPMPLGEFGEIVATSLSNYAMPLIRYRTGDMSALALPCPCGRGLATIQQVQTKWEHILRMADGRWISPSVLTHPFKPVIGIEKSQIVQEELGSVVIKVVANSHFDVQQQELLLRGFQERLGSEVKVTIVQVSSIPNDASGKFRWVVSNVQSEINQRIDRGQVGITS